MQKSYLRYFAKYKGLEKPFPELWEYMTNKFGVRDITRQPSIKTIGFSTDLKEVVEKIKNLEWITGVTCNGPAL